MSLQENKALVRHVLNELFSHQNLDVVDEYLAPDFVGHDAPPGISPGRQGVKEFVQARARAFSDSRFTIEDQVAEGDRVVTRWTAHHTHTGEFLGVPATGKEATVTGMMLHRIANGKIQEEWGEYDLFGLFRQIGAIAAPGSGG